MIKAGFKVSSGRRRSPTYFRMGRTLKFVDANSSITEDGNSGGHSKKAVSNAVQALGDSRLVGTKFSVSKIKRISNAVFSHDKNKKSISRRSI